MKNVGHVHCWKSHGAEGIKSGTSKKFRWHFEKEFLAGNLHLNSGKDYHLSE